MLALALVLASVAATAGQSAFVTLPALDAAPTTLAGTSALLGVVLAGVVILSGRATRKLGPLQELAKDLAQEARGAGTGRLLWRSASSAIAEEIVFRGLLVPVLGVVPAGLAFGLLHLGLGKRSLRWAAAATVFGLLLGTLYWLTGSLLGPVLAHALVNFENGRWLGQLEPAREGRNGIASRKQAYANIGGAGVSPKGRGEARPRD
jgi:membrane protease YdiL (CAAX protease family)